MSKVTKTEMEVNVAIQTIVANAMIENNWKPEDNVKMSISETYKFIDSENHEDNLFMKRSGYNPISLKNRRFTYKIKLAKLSTSKMRCEDKSLSFIVHSVIPICFYHGFDNISIESTKDSVQDSIDSDLQTEFNPPALSSK